MSNKATSSKRSVRLVPTLITPGLVGGVAAFAAQFYRRPIQTFNGLLHTGMLLDDARERTNAEVIS